MQKYSTYSFNTAVLGAELTGVLDTNDYLICFYIFIAKGEFKGKIWLTSG
jgi:hypothetical protein